MKRNILSHWGLSEAEWCFCLSMIEIYSGPEIVKVLIMDLFLYISVLGGFDF